METAVLGNSTMMDDTTSMVAQFIVGPFPQCAIPISEQTGISLPSEPSLIL